MKASILNRRNFLRVFSLGLCGLPVVPKLLSAVNAPVHNPLKLQTHWAHTECMQRWYSEAYLRAMEEALSSGYLR